MCMPTPDALGMNARDAVIFLVRWQPLCMTIKYAQSKPFASVEPLNAFETKAQAGGAFPRC